MEDEYLIQMWDQIRALTEESFRAIGHPYGYNSFDSNGPKRLGIADDTDSSVTSSIRFLKSPGFIPKAGDKVVLFGSYSDAVWVVGGVMDTSFTWRLKLKLIQPFNQS